MLGLAQKIIIGCLANDRGLLRTTLAVMLGLIWGCVPLRAMEISWEGNNGWADGSATSFGPRPSGQGSGPTSGNAVEINIWYYNNQLSGNVYGGLIDSGNDSTTGNKVIVTVDAWLTGDASDDAFASVYGGCVAVGSGNSTGNSVTLGGFRQGYPNPNIIVGDASSAAMQQAGGIYGGRINGTGTEVKGNSVLINYGTIAKRIYGGESGELANNNVTVSGNSVTVDLSAGGNLELHAASIIGGSSILGKATGNSVNIDTTGGIINLVGVTSSGKGVGVYGGTTGFDDGTTTRSGGDASGNNVILKDATYADTTSTLHAIFDEIRGGHVLAGSGNAERNTVTITNGQVGVVYGASVQSGLAKGNSVTIDDGLYDAIVGGESGTGESKGNAVTINGGEFTGKNFIADTSTFDASIIGGLSLDSALVMENSVVITGGEFTENVYGGYGYSGYVDSNAVTISAGDFVANIFGGYGHDGNGVDKSIVTITGGTMTGSHVYGGYANDGGSAEGNRVIIRGTEVHAVTGGYGNEDALRNTITITNGTVGGKVEGGAAGVNASDNTVTLSGTLVNGNVTGGVADGGEAVDNTVAITGGAIVGDVYGGNSGSALTTGLGSSGNKVNLARTDITGSVYGGHAWGNNADSNTVTLSGGTYGDSIYGGYTQTAHSAGGNIVNIGDVTLSGASGDIYGGYADAGGQTQNNTVTVTGYGNTFLSSTTLAGGNLESTGNTLTTKNASGMTLQEIRNFDNYNFVLSSGDLGSTVYAVSNPTDTTGTNVSLDFTVTGSAPLNEGDTITLISKTTGTEAGYMLNINGGFLYDYEGSIYITGADDSLVFGITRVSISDQTQTFGQAQMAGLQMANLASDFARNIPDLYAKAVGENCDNACVTPCGITCGAPQQGGPVLFAGVQGGMSRWDTGEESRTSLDHVSMLAGLGWSTEDGFLLTGYFEAGNGKYDAKIDGQKYVDGEDVKYVGGGALARWTFGGLYVEAGAHAGKLETDFSARMRSGNSTTHVGYDTKVAYFGGDAMLGYQATAGCSTFDLSAGYSWNRVDSDDFEVNGVFFEQGAVNSHRVRAGGEWSFAVGSTRPYLGARYEYEFGSGSSHMVAGRTLLEASMKGSSGIGEVGVRFGGKDSCFRADVGVEGYIGKRRGVTGKAMFGFSF